MKRSALFLTVLFSVILVSCGGKGKAFLDEHNCYMDMDEARENARKNKKDILVFITSEGDDFCSSTFIDEVVNTEEFDEKIGKDYTLYHVDFSQKSYEKTAVDVNASKEERERTERYADLLQTGYQFAVILNVGYTPAIFRLTADGYVVNEIDYEDEILEVDSFAQLLSKYDEQSIELKKKIEATKKGSNLEKVHAIDELYKSTPDLYKSFLNEIVSQIPELDKNNETGLCSRYIVLAAENKAVSIYANGDIYGAVQEFLQASENPFVNNDDKQECYYMASYLLGASGTGEIEVIVNYLKKGLELSPNSEKAKDMQSALEYYSSMLGK